ncbi:hypothetical protein AB0F17_35075 [Nonomuraea sp. NPDC026600]|uniref:hypothetical protein n=1 Tax=Nonomuraea sp. NPDC026600 TaxID=3155363 RepID=UPI0033CE5FCF
MLNPALPLRAALAELLNHLHGELSEACGPGCVRNTPRVGSGKIRCAPFEAAAAALENARAASTTAVALPVPSDTAAYGHPINTAFGQLSIAAGRVQLATACSECAHEGVRTADPNTTMLIAAAFGDAAEKATEPDPAEVNRLIGQLRHQPDFAADHSWPGYQAASAIITSLLRGHTIAAKAAE